MMLGKCTMDSKALTVQVGHTEASCSLLKRGHVKGVRFETQSSNCAAPTCQPANLLEYCAVRHSD